jgi:N,N'-diacetyllegionaminate synthase
MFAHTSTYIIAEIGSNHDGRLDKALSFVDACAQAGVNAVKFQTWDPPKLHDPTNAEVMAILERYRLPFAWHPELRDRCALRGVDFLSTPFDVESARFLRDLGVPAMKISSSDLVYDELVAEIGSYGLPVILSTGMANLQEIAHALDLLGRDRDDIVLLQCTAAYPPEIADANLRALTTLRNTFGKSVGLSDHYPGHHTVIAGVALGASVIEKHVTMSRSAGTPDAPFALEMDELAALVDAVRVVELALGDGVKVCKDSEREGLRGGRRGVFAARDLSAGETLSREAVAVVRPGISELKPGDLAAILEKRVTCDIPAGTALGWQHIEH